MVDHNLDLFYNIYNNITEHNRRQNHYLSSIVNYFDIYFHVNQKVFFIISSASSSIIIFMLSCFEWITRSSDFLRAFTMSFKHGLILSRFTFVFNIIITPKSIYSYRFVMILFFFFILKNIPNISKYYMFNFFNFFL